MEPFKKAYAFLLEKARITPRKRAEETGPRFADLNDRALASAVDVLLLYLFLFPLFLRIQRAIYVYIDRNKLRTLGGLEEPSFTQGFAILWEAGYPQLWVLNALIQVAIIGAVIVALQLKFGATPGKKLLGLRIADAKTHEAPSRFQYIVRFIGYIPATLCFMAGLFWISFNKERRGWHDIMAGTVVLHTRPRGWYWQQVKRGFFWLKTKLTSDNTAA